MTSPPQPKAPAGVRAEAPPSLSFRAKPRNLSGDALSRTNAPERCFDCVSGYAQHDNPSNQPKAPAGVRRGLPCVPFAVRAGCASALRDECARRGRPDPVTLAVHDLVGVPVYLRYGLDPEAVPGVVRVRNLPRDAAEVVVSLVVRSSEAVCTSFSPGGSPMSFWKMSSTPSRFQPDVTGTVGSVPAGSTSDSIVSMDSNVRAWSQ